MRICAVGIRGVIISVMLFVLAAAAVQAGGGEYYKMISTVEYSGAGQFRSQAEMLFTVGKETLSDGKARYVLSGQDMAAYSDDGSMSFVVDGKNQGLDLGGKDLAFLNEVSSLCGKTLQKANMAVGKTYQKSFNLSAIKGLPFEQLKFALTSMKVNSEKSGSLVAVRALSEPFTMKVTDSGGKSRPVSPNISWNFHIF